MLSLPVYYNIFMATGLLQLPSQRSVPDEEEELLLETISGVLPELQSSLSLIPKNTTESKLLLRTIGTEQDAWSVTIWSLLLSRSLIMMYCWS